MTKTTRVMLAVLAVCGTSAALAQSSVTLYGRINTSVEHQKLGNASATGLVSSGSYLGFTGTEDLGNGLKAGFVLEGTVEADTGGTGYSFDRQSELNLSGNFGMLRLGSFDPYSYTVTADAISMHNHDTGPTADMLYDGVLWGGNKIAYRTPTIAGFDAEVQYQFGEKQKNPDLTVPVLGKTTGTHKNGWDLGVNYANGPLGLGFGYSNLKYSDVAAVSGAQTKFSQFALRASYEIGDLTLGAYYQKQDTKAANQKAKRDVYRVSAKYVIGASELHANIGQASKYKVNGTKTGNSATQWTLAYNYNLSKRTKVYALYSNLSHTESAGIDFKGSFTMDPSNGSDKFRTMGIGIRHFF
ncbi:porin [Comamonas kerstersii]|uniref:porin n=1 Tax=Comamonas kerstersii TaxID=225992 RepID=UPI00345C94A3